jgi:hypothetical protein
MTQRLFLSLLALTFAAPAVAQQACTPRDTPPDSASVSQPPVLFLHCAAEGKCGAVDKTGAWKVPPKFRDLLIEDEFIVAPENDDWSKYGFLDASGKRLGGGDYTINAEEGLPVSEGLMPVIVNEKMGYADRTGAIVVKAEYDEAYAFLDGAAIVTKDEKKAFIDKTGKEILKVPAGIEDVMGFFGDVAIVSKDGKSGLMNKTGKITVEPKFDSIFFDNGVLTALEGEKWGIIDATGTFVAKPEFDVIESFASGLAPALAGEKWGFIDTCGAWKIPAKYDAVLGFAGGPARVKLGTKWGLVDKTGAEILPVSLPYIGEEWQDGFVTFSADEKKDPPAADPNVAPDQQDALADDAKYGLLDTGGKVALEAKYDSLDLLGGGVLLSYVGEEEKMLNLDGSEIKIAAP